MKNIDDFFDTKCSEIFMNAVPGRNFSSLELFLYLNLKMNTNISKELDDLVASPVYLIIGKIIENEKH